MAWKYDPKRQRITAGELIIAEVRGWGQLQNHPGGAEIQDYNGRLIAAAPRLHCLFVKYGRMLKSCFHRLKREFEK